MPRTVPRARAVDAGAGADAEGGLDPARIAQLRARLGPDKEIVVPLELPRSLREYAAAGATWLISGPEEADLAALADSVAAQAAAGPPR